MEIEQFKQFYAGKKVFLTGHTGFKGSWLVSWLKQLNCEVKGYSLAPEHENSLYNVLNGDALCESVIDDIRNREKLKKELLSFEPDIVFHLAAQPLVIDAYNDPVYTYDVNVTGTAIVLDALRFLQKPCNAVMITTDKVYHNDETGRPYKETDRLGGYDPYSASKAAAEIVIDSYRQSFFHPAKYSTHGKTVSVARSGNVIGGGDWSANRIIPDLVRAIITNEELVIRNHRSVRPWQHVLEPLSGYLMLAYMQSTDAVKYADAFNFGPDPSESVTVEELIKVAIAHWGKGSYRVVTNADAVHEAGLLQLDIGKSAAILNWHPLYNAHKAIEETINWYKSFNEHPQTIASFTQQQIAEYEMAMF
ncbi:MAG: CDP-glucose 4,6-dehydratase [Lacibacter sp.]